MIKNDNGFVCRHCGKEVFPLKYTSRDHCPHCLYSIHIDNIPGDRANTCLGDLVPVAIENDSKKGYVIVYKCNKCGMLKRNKSADDDDFEKILQVSKNYANWQK
ncbi:MAG: RNHCP domain-containing protein [Clostridia bacterium]|nr:RNHCP domain-containing protein [Clostridia bacterium]